MCARLSANVHSCAHYIVCVGVAPHPNYTTISNMCEHVAHRQSSDVCCMCKQVDPHIILKRFSGYCPQFMCQRGLMLKCVCSYWCRPADHWTALWGTAGSPDHGSKVWEHQPPSWCRDYSLHPSEGRFLRQRQENDYWKCKWLYFIDQNLKLFNG